MVAVSFIILAIATGGCQLINAFEGAQTSMMRKERRSVGVSAAGRSMKPISAVPDAYHKHWWELTQKQQGAAKHLGYTDETWRSNVEPSLLHADWGMLLASQRHAASTLGWAQHQWDSHPKTGRLAYSAALEQERKSGGGETLDLAVEAGKPSHPDHPGHPEYKGDADDPQHHQEGHQEGHQDHTEEGHEEPHETGDFGGPFEDDEAVEHPAPALGAHTKALAPFEDTGPVAVAKARIVAEAVCPDFCNQCWIKAAGEQSGVCSVTTLQDDCEQKTEDNDIVNEATGLMLGDKHYWCPVQRVREKIKLAEAKRPIPAGIPPPPPGSDQHIAFAYHALVLDRNTHCYVDPEIVGQVKAMQSHCADPKVPFCNGIACSPVFGCRYEAIKLEGTIYRRDWKSKGDVYNLDAASPLPEWASPMMYDSHEAVTACNTLVGLGLQCRGFICYKMTTRQICNLLAESIPVWNRFEKGAKKTGPGAIAAEGAEEHTYEDACFVETKHLEYHYSAGKGGTMARHHGTKHHGPSIGGTIRHHGQALSEGLQAESIGSMNSLAGESSQHRADRPQTLEEMTRAGKPADAPAADAPGGSSSADLSKKHALAQAQKLLNLAKKAETEKQAAKAQEERDTENLHLLLAKQAAANRAKKSEEDEFQQHFGVR